jgi:hypothetical protein
MATSPDYLRLATSAARALADTALDGLRDAVLVVDARLKQLPIVLANRAACDSLRAEGDTSPLIEVPLLRLLGAESIVTFERVLAELLESKGTLSGKGTLIRRGRRIRGGRGIPARSRIPNRYRSRGRFPMQSSGSAVACCGNSRKGSRRSSRT